MLGLVSAASCELEHVVRGLGLAARAKLSRVLRGDGRAVGMVADRHGPEATPFRELARDLELAAVDAHRGHRLEHRELERRVGQSLEETARALVGADRAVEVTLVVERRSDAHVTARGDLELGR